MKIVYRRRQIKTKTKSWCIVCGFIPIRKVEIIKKDVWQICKIYDDYGKYGIWHERFKLLAEYETLNIWQSDIECIAQQFYDNCIGEVSMEGN